MFKMNEETKALFSSKPKKMTRAKALEQRKNVYNYIWNNPDKALSRVELGTAAGYDMSDSTSISYRNGYQFITNMINNGHLKEEIDRYNIGKYVYYVTTKDKVETIRTEKLEPEIKSQDDYLKKSVKEIQEIDLKIESRKFNFRFYVSESGRAGESVDIELDGLTEEEIISKIKKVIELV